MAEVVKKLGLPPQDGFLYFVEKDGTVWKHQGGKKTIISKAKVEREEGYLYFIDLNGDNEIDEDEILAYGASPAKDEINYEVMEVGMNEVTVVVEDNDGSTERTIFIIEVTPAPVESSAVEVAQEVIGSNLPLFDGLSEELVLVLGRIAWRSNRRTEQTVYKLVYEGLPKI